MKFLLCIASVGLSLVASVDPPPPPSFFNCSAQPAHAFTSVVLKNSHGMTGEMIAYGATMTHLMVPNKLGGKSDVLLGWDDQTQYCQNAINRTYFGATIGRIANRIAKCEFPLGGRMYKVSCNEKDFDTLHGGVVGFDRAVWQAVAQTESSVTWSRLSPDGEMGFPGNVRINVTHTITESNEWTIEYSASTDKETVIAMTNHAYFNLDAFVDNTQTVMGHVMKIYNADSIQDVTGAPDYHSIATGKMNKIVPGSPWDFSEAKTIGKDIDHGTVSAKGGYDNAWMFSDSKPGMKVRPVLAVSSGITGIALEMHTDQPSVQIYSGNFLLGNIPRKASQSAGKDKQYYQYRSAFTLEAQQYIDAVNNPQFPSVTLVPGKRYQQHTRYAFSTQPQERVIV